MKIGFWEILIIGIIYFFFFRSKGKSAKLKKESQNSMNEPKNTEPTQSSSTEKREIDVTESVHKGRDS